MWLSREERDELRELLKELIMDEYPAASRVIGQLTANRTKSNKDS